MRSLMYLAGVVPAIAIGMFQGPRETGIATVRQTGSWEPLCNNSGIDTGTDCPAKSGQTCSDTYDPYNSTKPWTEKVSALTLDCKETGCQYSWSAENRSDECEQVD